MFRAAHRLTQPPASKGLRRLRQTYYNFIGKLFFHTHYIIYRYYIYIHTMYRVTFLIRLIICRTAFLRLSVPFRRDRIIWTTTAKRPVIINVDCTSEIVSSKSFEPYNNYTSCEVFIEKDKSSKRPISIP